jgi:hypothetical protein
MAELQEDLAALDAGLAVASDDPRLAEARAAATRLAAHFQELMARMAEVRAQQP